MAKSKAEPGISVGKIRVFELADLEALFDVKEHTLVRYVRTGKLKARKIGKKWYVSEDALGEFFLTWEHEETTEEHSLLQVSNNTRNRNMEAEEDNDSSRRRQQ